MSDALERQAWHLRWRASRFLIHLGIAIAPAGPARDLLMRYLNAFGDEILRAYRQAQPRNAPFGYAAPSETINAPHGANTRGKA